MREIKGGISTRVLLVNVPYVAVAYKYREGSADIVPPLGLASIAAYLRKNGVEIEILDANAEALGIAETIEEIRKRDCDIIGFGTTTATMRIVLEVAGAVKSGRNRVVLGGPHASCLPVPLLERFPFIDAIVIGEGERSFLEMIPALQDGTGLESVPGIAFNRHEGVIVTAPRESIRNLDSLPFPARDLLPLDRYRPGPIINIGYSGRAFGAIITSRGCAENCAFCASGAFWKGLRLRSADNVIAEMRLLVRRYGVRHMMIYDDCFTVNPKRARAICRGIIDNDLRLLWGCYSRVSSSDRDTLLMMKRAGCYFIYYGIESGNQSILDDMGKRMTLGEARRAVDMARELGFLVNCSFILGLPGESEATVRRTIDFAKELDPSVVEFYVAAPFPGTKIREMAKIYGGFGDGDDRWISIRGEQDVRTCELEPGAVQQLAMKCYREFYFRGSFVLSSLRQLARNPRLFQTYWGCFKILIRSSLRRVLP